MKKSLNLQDYEIMYYIICSFECETWYLDFENIANIKLTSGEIFKLSIHSKFGIGNIIAPVPTYAHAAIYKTLQIAL